MPDLKVLREIKTYQTHFAVSESFSSGSDKCFAVHSFHGEREEGGTQRGNS